MINRQIIVKLSGYNCTNHSFFEVISSTEKRIKVIPLTKIITKTINIAMTEVTYGEAIQFDSVSSFTLTNRGNGKFSYKNSLYELTTRNKFVDNSGYQGWSEEDNNKWEEYLKTK